MLMPTIFTRDLFDDMFDHLILSACNLDELHFPPLSTVTIA